MAILLVLAAHSHPSFAYAHVVSAIGDLGVDVFFAISGYLICSRLLDEERLTGSLHLRGFYVRRFFRILPAAYLYLGIVAVLALLRIAPLRWEGWIGAVFFFRNYWNIPDLPPGGAFLTGQFWSLAVEEHFYLLLPAILVIFRQTRKYVLGGLLVACLVRQVWWLFAMADGGEGSEFHTDLRIGALLFPALLAVLLSRSEARERLARFVRPWTAACAMALLMAVLIAPAVWEQSDWVPDTPSAEVAESAPPTELSNGFTGRYEIAHMLVIPLLFPFLVLSTVLHHRSWLARLLEWKAMRVVGRMSYSIYLWQQIYLGRWDNASWPIRHVEDNRLVGLALAFLTAAVSYLLIEKPAIRLGHRLARPAREGHADLATAAEG